MVRPWLTEAAASAAGLPSRAWTAITPWPGAGTKTSLNSAPPASRLRSSRSRPAAASTSTSTSPAASLRSRVSTFPRSSTTLQVGRTAAAGRAGAERWSPPARPRVRRRVLLAHQHIERVGPPRRGHDAVPGASSAGTSLAECTARSCRHPSERGLERVHPARLVADGEAGVAGRGDRDQLGRLREQPCTARAWASASVLPRVPIRSGCAVKAGAARGPRRAAPPPRSPGARPARTARAGAGGARGGGPCRDP